MQVQSKFYVYFVSFYSFKAVSDQHCTGEACEVRLCHLGMAGARTAGSCRYIEWAVAVAAWLLDETLETLHDKNNTESDTV